MKPPLDHRIKRPFEYTPSTSTDIRRTFERIREQLKQRAPVVPIKKEIA